MTVGQSKMLFKRYYQLSPKHQRLMMQDNGSQDMPIDLDEMQILLQSNEFDKRKKDEHKD